MKRTLVSLILVIALFTGMFAGLTTMAEETAYPEEITIFSWLSEHVSKIGLVDYNGTYMWQELEKRTGTKVSFELLPAGADMMAQLNLMVASRDLTDVINGVDWRKVSGGATLWEEDGVIIDLTELIPQYMPNYNEQINTLDGLLKSLLIDGKLYYIAEIGAGAPYMGPIIRKDWLDKANLKEPETIDELYEVLVYFRDHDMNENGDASDEWAMSGLASGNWSPFTLMNAWGVNESFQLVDGKVTHGMLLPEFTEAITFLNKLYTEGLLDPDYATQDRNALDGKFMNNLVGFEEGIQPSKMNNALNPDAQEGLFEATGLKNMKLTADSPAYVFNTMYTSYQGSVQAALTTECKEPEKVLAWFDYFFSEEGADLFNWGIEGVSYVVDEQGNRVADFTKALEKDPAYDINSIKYLYTASGTSAYPYVNDYGYYLSTLHPFSAHGIDQWKLDYDISRLLPDLSPSAEEQEKINDQLVDINTYVSIELNKLVNGQTPLEQIPDVQAKLISMGIEDVLEVYQAVYERFIAE